MKNITNECKYIELEIAIICIKTDVLTAECDVIKRVLKYKKRKMEDKIDEYFIF